MTLDKIKEKYKRKYKNDFSLLWRATTACYYNMINRCYRLKNDNYNQYGKRDIKVCDRWLGKKGLLFFLEDMKLKPSKNYDIHRLNFHKNYEPINCMWIERSLHHKLHREFLQGLKFKERNNIKIVILKVRKKSKKCLTCKVIISSKQSFCSLKCIRKYLQERKLNEK